MFAKVIVEIKVVEVDKVFEYKIGKEWFGLCQKGVRVLVPFGSRNKKIEGFVMGVSDEPNGDYVGRFKYISEVLDDGNIAFTDTAIRLAEYMQKRYFCTLSSCLQTIKPSVIKTKTEWCVGISELTFPRPVIDDYTQKIYDYLLESEGISYKEMEKRFGKDVNNALDKLEKLNYIYKVQKINKGEFKRMKTYYQLHRDIDSFDEVVEKISNSTRYAKQLEVFREFGDGDLLSLEYFKSKNVSMSSIKSLEKTGLLSSIKMEDRREAFDKGDYLQSDAFVPTEEQEVVLNHIYTAMESDFKKPVLLHGITGSGKTEIYLQAIEENMKRGKSAIVLVPEIALTPQIMNQFVSRFGDVVSITHSRMTSGERADQWRKARDGEISIMIGPRSAIFAPFDNLGIVIIDEIHETTYISDSVPKYDAREVAIELARLSGALLIMGSATPNIEFYYRGMQGEFDILTMKNRAGGGELPHINLIDMRFELASGNMSPFSYELQNAISENLQRKEQTMLFLNRRGYATFVSCRGCGHVMQCPECELPYTYHSSRDDLLCHHCGITEETPKTCPKCESKYIRFFGTGTQKIEEEANRLFPEARILRMDFDTTKNKMSFQSIIESFRKGDGDILIGTQMIAKGHDFPNVTLMGIMAADTSLNVGSFYGCENTFQLITQSAGRAGRARAGGKVYLQTYQPDNYAIKHGKNQDYKGFYNEELLLRQVMKYPPFGSFFSVIVLDKRDLYAGEIASRLANSMRGKVQGISVLGPVPTSQRKIDGDFGHRVLIQGTDESELIDFVMKYVDIVKKNVEKSTYFNLTLNPRYIV